MRALRLDLRQRTVHAGAQTSESLANGPVNSDTVPCLALNETPRPTIPRGDSSVNIVDRIQDELQDNGHRAWGYVIHRCTYGDDAA